MGDMADFLLDADEDVADRRLAWRLGHIDVREAYDRGIVDELGYEFEQPYHVTCRYCGRPDLAWCETHKGWRLMSADHALHSCYERRQHEAIHIFREAR